MAEEQFRFDLTGGGGPDDDDAFAPETIRREAHGFLAEARAVTPDAPWDEGEVRYRRIIFPHLVSWLPEEEANQLRFAFARELERIELLLAA